MVQLRFYGNLSCVFWTWYWIFTDTHYKEWNEKGSITKQNNSVYISICSFVACFLICHRASHSPQYIIYLSIFFSIVNSVLLCRPLNCINLSCYAKANTHAQLYRFGRSVG